MSDRIKILLAKSSVVVAGAFLLLWFPIIPIVGTAVGKSFEEYGPIWWTDFVLFLASSVVMVVFQATFRIKQKPVKAERLELPFEDFDGFREYLAASALGNGYEQQPERSCDGDGSVTVFVKPHGWKEIDSITLVRVAELTDERIDVANKTITEALLEYYGTERITDSVNMITVVCVDRITPTFRTYVNSNIQQGLKNGWLPVGISFGGRGIYIAKQKDGFASAKYKRLRKEFLMLIQS